MNSKGKANLRKMIKLNIVKKLIWYFWPLILLEISNWRIIIKTIAKRIEIKSEEVEKSISFYRYYLIFALMSLEVYHDSFFLALILILSMKVAVNFCSVLWGTVALK